MFHSVKMRFDWQGVLRYKKIYAAPNEIILLMLPAYGFQRIVMRQCAPMMRRSQMTSECPNCSSRQLRSQRHTCKFCWYVRFRPGDDLNNKKKSKKEKRKSRSGINEACVGPMVVQGSVEAASRRMS